MEFNDLNLVSLQEDFEPVEDQELVNLGVMEDVFGKENPSESEIKAKFGSLDPSVETIIAKVDKDILKKHTGSEKPTHN